MGGSSTNLPSPPVYSVGWLIALSDKLPRVGFMRLV